LSASHNELKCTTLLNFTTLIIRCVVTSGSLPYRGSPVHVSMLTRPANGGKAQRCRMTLQSDAQPCNAWIRQMKRQHGPDGQIQGRLRQALKGPLSSEDPLALVTADFEQARISIANQLPLQLLYHVLRTTVLRSAGAASRRPADSRHCSHRRAEFESRESATPHSAQALSHTPR
jgi:hypothetical protein